MNNLILEKLLLHNLVFVILQNSRGNNIIIENNSFNIKVIKELKLLANLNQPGFGDNNNNDNKNNNNNNNNNVFVDNSPMLFRFESDNGLFCY